MQWKIYFGPALLACTCSEVGAPTLHRRTARAAPARRAPVPDDRSDASRSFTLGFVLRAVGIERRIRRRRELEMGGIDGAAAHGSRAQSDYCRGWRRVRSCAGAGDAREDHRCAACDFAAERAYDACGSARDVQRHGEHICALEQAHDNIATRTVDSSGTMNGARKCDAAGSKAKSTPRLKDRRPLQSQAWELPL
jgi:hypothetical protein